MHCAVSYLNMNGVELVADLLTPGAGGKLVHRGQASTKSGEGSKFNK